MSCSMCPVDSLGVVHSNLCSRCLRRELTALRAQLAQVTETAESRDRYAHQENTAAQMRQLGEIVDLKHDLAQVQREAAFMRWVVECAKTGGCEEVGPPCGECLACEAGKALKLDAGKGLLTDSECQARVNAAVAQEREECAELASMMLNRSYERGIPDAIRARATKEET